MGLFSRLFSKNMESSSYIRRWLAREMGKVDKDSADPFALFVELIHTASRFAKENVTEQDKQARETAKHYLGDATIFEIACYTYYRMESWLCKNEPELRAQVADPVAFWLVEIFSVAWRKDEAQVRPLLAERLDVYRAVVRSGKGTEELHLELAGRVVNTKGGQFSGNQQVNNDMDLSFVKTSLELLEDSHISAFMTTTQEFCKNQIKPVTEDKKQLSLDEQADQEKRDYLFALALLEHNDLVKALKAFTKVLGSNPNHYNALLQRGRIYILQRQPLEAVEDFSKAIEVNPNDYRAYLERGKCYHRDWPMWDKAMADYAKAIDLAPDHAASYFERGSLYDEMAMNSEKHAFEQKDRERHSQASEEFRAAIQDYTQAIALNPQYDEAYVGRGLAYARKVRINKEAEMVEKAIADMEKAMSLNWENGYLYKTVGELKELLESGRQPELSGR